MSANAAALHALLTPYVDREFERTGRLVQYLRPSAGGPCGSCCPTSHRALLGQPPMSWLGRQAHLLGGQQVGKLVRGRAYVHFDGVQLAPESAGTLAERLAADGPATTESDDALTTTLVETWTSWTATKPSWTGTGSELRAKAVAPDTACVGFWWD